MESKKATVLKRSSDFLVIQQKGKRKTLSPWLVMGYRKNEMGSLRFGCTISRKVGSAVTRNRLKRWTREYFRKATTHEHSPPFDLNLVFRPMPEGFYQQLRQKDYFGFLDQGFRILSA